MQKIRRTVLVTATALALLLPAAGAVPALAADAPVTGAAVTAAAVRTAAPDGAPYTAAARLPRPTGPFAVGRDVVELTDRHRTDPWVPAAGPRRLMVSMYYPARPGTGSPAAYMTEAEARSMLEGKAPGSTTPPSRISGIRTWSRTAARPLHGRFPLVVLSPGFTLPRATLTGLAEDLTSRGYVVALVDHTYENTGTTFPDGTTLPCAICEEGPGRTPDVVARSRAKDVRFVLDRLTGRRADWKRADLIDRSRIGMAGHSLGGTAAAASMATDRRIRAGVNMDGGFFVPVPRDGLDGRPFLLFGQQDSAEDASWKRAWSRLDGWKRWLTVTGANHLTFTDGPLLADLAGIPFPDDIGPQRSERLTRTYVAAFFDRHLKGIARPVLDGPSTSFPEVHVRRP
ncbi:alpha/beta hydrolase family protein [Streptomyces sp. NPDC093225]|uniref:alpha/beta hydrolase family protein n=1 Tax=Streptomyces sp. NPDC093225 TaxID=3366034 RepID=UPI0038228AEA